MTAHTPGPWHWAGDGILVNDDGDEVIASGIDLYDSPDARLIAAAPELLAALRLLCEEAVIMFGPVAAARSPGLGCARDAIAKAEGRKPSVATEETEHAQAECECDEPRRCTCGGKFAVDEDGCCACCGMDVTAELARYQEGYVDGIEDAAKILDETSRDAAKTSIREHARKAAAAIRSLRGET